MDEMEVVFGNRDPLVEFSDTMAQWYRCYQSAQTEPQGPSPESPVDSSPYWIIHVIECSEPLPGAGRLKRADLRPLKADECLGKSTVMVTDASGLLLGFDVLPRDWYIRNPESGTCITSLKIINMILRLVQRCTEAPMCGGTPRRPSLLKTTDKVLQRLVNNHLEHQNLGSPQWSLPSVWDRLSPGINQQWDRNFSLRWPPVYCCNACRRKSFPSRLKECSQCRAVFYCEDKCSPADEHQRWCARLATHMKHEAQLADVPFSYAQEVMSKDFSVEDFLFRHKLDKGYWLHWSMLLRCQPQVIPAQERAMIQEDDWLHSHSDGYGPLKHEAALLTSTPKTNISLKKPLVSWREYFMWRGLDLSSVVAPLLSSALSIYYIITSLVPQHFPDSNILEKQSIRIHIIESYRELQTLSTFWELSMLFPHVIFDLVFTCEHLPLWSDNMKLYMQQTDEERSPVTITTHPPPFSTVRRTVRVKVHHGVYLTLQDHEPDLIVGFKPHFAGKNSSWYRTLTKLQSLRVPAYFCEIYELRCENSQEVMNAATGGTVSPPIINPFRCPLRINGGDNNLPKYSNAFIFHLIYKPLGNLEKANAKVVPVHPPPVPPKLPYQEKKAGKRCHWSHIKRNNKLLKL